MSIMKKSPYRFGRFGGVGAASARSSGMTGKLGVAYETAGPLAQRQQEPTLGVTIAISLSPQRKTWVVA
jgi:hypothetical protein